MTNDVYTCMNPCLVKSLAYHKLRYRASQNWFENQKNDSSSEQKKSKGEGSLALQAPLFTSLYTLLINHFSHLSQDITS